MVIGKKHTLCRNKSLGIGAYPLIDEAEMNIMDSGMIQQDFNDL
jgi:hypothetical protein